MKYTWKIKSGQYQSGSNMYLNRLRIGGFEWNSMRSRGSLHEDNDWKGSLYLPSLRNPTVYSGTQEGVQAKLELLADSWFVEALPK